MRHAGKVTQLSDLELAEELMHTCYEMYRQTATGLAPESGRFNAEDPRFAMTTVQAQNLLRPETVESLFILHLSLIHI